MVELFRPFKNTKKNQIVKKKFIPNSPYQNELRKPFNTELQVIPLII